MKLALRATLLSATLFAPAAFAQDVVTATILPHNGVSAQSIRTGRATGTLDQVSPFASEVVGAATAGFNGSASSLVWQTDVRAGMAGTLEGFEIECTGVIGANIDLRIHLGGGWTSNPVVWSGNYSKITGGTEIGWLDTSAAGISLNVGDLFVIEWQGTDTGLGMTGSYAAPPAIPAYPELIFLNGPGCFADCGWRIGFHTYMSSGGPTLSSTPLVGGSTATLTVTGATPSNSVGYAYSLVGPGPSSVSAGPCGSLTLDLSAPVVILAILPADASGNVSFTGLVPLALSGRMIWLQAVDVASCTPTNGLAEAVG